MKAVMMNEIESAIVEWVTKNDKHGRAFIGEEFINKGYPFAAIESAFDKLLNDGTLRLDEQHYVVFDWPDDLDYPAGVQLMLDKMMSERPTPAVDAHGGFPTQLDKDKNPAVHSPSHYTRGGIETIDFIEAKGLNFHLGNVVKYVSRAGFKQDAKIQDLEKALWYLTREINRVKTQEP